MLTDKELALWQESKKPTIERMKDLHETKKKIEAEFEALKKELEPFMIDNSIKKMMGDGLIATLVDASESTSIDTSALKKHEPKLFNELLEDYPKVTRRKAYVRFNFN